MCPGKPWLHPPGPPPHFLLLSRSNVCLAFCPEPHSSDPSESCLGVVVLCHSLALTWSPGVKAPLGHLPECQQMLLCHPLQRPHRESSEDQGGNTSWGGGNSCKAWRPEAESGLVPYAP